MDGAYAMEVSFFFQGACGLGTSTCFVSYMTDALHAHQKAAEKAREKAKEKAEKAIAEERKKVCYMYL